MANWATTSYVIEGDAQTIKKIKDVLEKLEDGLIKPYNNSSKEWEGNIILALGGEIKNNESMRGFVLDYDCGDDTVTIHAEEAWCLTDFRFALKRIFPEVEVYFMIEEPGCEIYQTNDYDGKYYPERYCIDCCVNGDCQVGYFEDMEGVWKFLEEYGVQDFDDVSKFNEERKEDDEFIYIHEYEFVD